MRFCTSLSLLLALTLTLIIPPAYGHHATGVSFDGSRSVKIEGVVKRFIFKNPHPYLYMEVVENGQKIEYIVEFNQSTGLKEQGWTDKTLKPGDVVIVTGRPSRAPGTHGVHVAELTKDGKKLYGGNTD